MSVFFSEFLGSAFLILLGNGVVSNVVLAQTKGHGSGWIVISLGWAMAVFVGVYISVSGSGGHLNPVVSFSMAYLGRLPWHEVPVYLCGQILGTMAGSLAVWLTYKKHFDLTENPELKLAAFCTIPAIRHKGYNFLTETIATFVLMIGVLFLASPATKLGSVEALPVSLLILAIGLSLGGPTGYAINPARDLGPRIMHFILPIKNKRNSDWGYAWVPILGPILGGLLATWVYHVFQTAL